MGKIPDVTDRDIVERFGGAEEGGSGVFNREGNFVDDGIVVVGNGEKSVLHIVGDVSTDVFLFQLRFGSIEEIEKGLIYLIDYKEVDKLKKVIDVCELSYSVSLYIYLMDELYEDTKFLYLFLMNDFVPPQILRKIFFKLKKSGDLEKSEYIDVLEALLMNYHTPSDVLIELINLLGEKYRFVYYLVIERETNVTSEVLALFTDDLIGGDNGLLELVDRLKVESKSRVMDAGWKKRYLSYLIERSWY